MAPYILGLTNDVSSYLLSYTVSSSSGSLGKLPRAVGDHHRENRDAAYAVERG